jgi:aerobic carbon-monoxide dehydrogenase medium subunit
MIPAPFDYHAPTTLDEALALLARLGDTAKILAGGQSLIPAMRFRLASPEVLVDLNRISDLAYLEERGDHLAIGALTREHALERSPLVASSYPLLLDTAKVIADPLVRNKATVGGNLAHADPANDHPAAMLAYDAQIIARSPTGNRTIAIDDLFVGLFETSLLPGEILAEIRIPKPTATSGGAYLKIERKVGDYAVAAVAVQLALEPGLAGSHGPRIRHIRIGLTNVSAIPGRARAAEAALTGQAPTDDVLEAAGRAAAGECDPTADLRGQVDYKRDLVRVLTKRAVRRAVERAQGGRP